MWERIRFGARWRTGERTALAIRGMDLKNVKSIQFSFDPFHHDCRSLRTFWFLISSPYVQRTNQLIKVKCNIKNDRQPPYFYADLNDGKKLLFRTSGMHVMDLLMTFNRLLGNPEFGKSGIRPLPKID
uniref:Large ribosomal subunit protein mL53 n=1 Tax=Setaria digitata TaxID=48799 RepID=A0A915PL17_9BILA